jgi:MFS family permease
MTGEGAAPSSTAHTRRLPLAALVASNLISVTGSRIAGVALPWYVLTRTNSARDAGLTAAVTVIPVVLAAALGGTLVDRVGHRKASVISDLVSTVASAAIPAADALIGFNLSLLLILVFVGALLTVPASSARQSLVPELAAMAATPLHEANAAIGTMTRLPQLIGPVLAGLLIGLIGPTGALWMNAASFLISAAVIFFLVPKMEGVASRASSYLGDLRSGLTFLRGDGLLGTIIVAIAASNLLVTPVLAVVLPVYGIQVLQSPIALGALLGVFGAGAVAGAGLYGLYGRALQQRILFVACFFLSGAPFGLLALTDQPLAAFVVLGLIGLAAGPINPMTATIIQQRTPAALRATVFGGVLAATWVAIAPGMVFTGYAITEIGVRGTLAYTGVVFVVITALGARLPGLMELDRSALVGARAATR